MNTDKLRAMSNMGFTLRKLRLLDDSGWIRWPLVFDFRKGSEL